MDDVVHGEFEFVKELQSFVIVPFGGIFLGKNVFPTVLCECSLMPPCCTCTRKLWKDIRVQTMQIF